MKRCLLVGWLSLILIFVGCEKDNANELKETDSTLKTVSVAEFLDAPESSEIWYLLTGEILAIESDVYGDFTIADETASVYIYGMTRSKVSTNDKSFSDLGLGVGDVVTLATHRRSHKGKPEGGGSTEPAYYISHVSKENVSDDSICGESGGETENGADENDGNRPDNKEDALKAKLIGKWKIQSFYDEYLIYLNNGEGYLEEMDSYGGIKRWAFKWDLVDASLEVEWLRNGSKRTIEFEFLDNGNMRQSSREYKKISDSGTTEVDYKNPPFKSYILYADTYYYELSKAVMRCNHSSGTESNSKFLQLFGDNGLLDPTGVVFTYFTPYYEGIDNLWLDGTYYLTSKSTNWVYGGYYFTRGVNSYRLDGELEIKTKNQIKYIDFEFEDGTIGHFEGKFN